MNNSTIEKAKNYIQRWQQVQALDRIEDVNVKEAVLIIKELLEDSGTTKLPQRYSKKEFSKDSHYYQLAEIIFNSANKLRNTYTRYLENLEAIEIVLQNNAYEIYKLVEKERKPIQEVIDVLEWALNDGFWKVNILSARKFQEQYNELRIQKYGRYDPDPEMTKKLVGIFRALNNNPEYNPHEGAKAKFIEAGKKVKEFFGPREIGTDQGIEYLLNCLVKNFIDKSQIVYPGTLCSPNTWDILMPQYLAEIGLD